MSAAVFSARLSPAGIEAEGPTSFRAGRTAAEHGALAAWRWADGRLSIERDRCGVQPLFWSVTPSAVQVSASIDALLTAGVPAELDAAAMAVFLRVGFFVGDDTPFAAIRAVPHAESVTWSADEGIRLGGEWRYPASSSIDRATAVDRFAECFTAAVARDLRRAGDPVAVPLSGGHDSRHILFAMHELHRLPDHCVTVHPYPPAAAEDVAIAATVAAAAGARHVVLPQRQHRIGAEREKNLLTHYCADEHVQFLPLRDYFSTRRCDVFDGLAGDVLSQSQRLSPELHADFADGRFEQAAERVLGDARAIEPALARLLTRPAAARFNRQLAVSRLAAEMARHAGAPNPIAGFFFCSRMRREIALAPYALLDVCPVSTPFLDAELVDLLLSLPFALVADRTLHTETLQRRYPAFAHLPFDGKRRGSDEGRDVRRQAAGLLALALTSRSELIDSRALSARAGKAFVTGKSAQLWFLSRLIHLLEVEKRNTEFTEWSTEPDPRLRSAPWRRGRHVLHRPS